jgi:hypothetical protein
MPLQEFVTPFLHLSRRKGVGPAAAEAMEQSFKSNVPVHYCLTFTRLLFSVGFEQVVKKDQLGLWFGWPFALADCNADFFAKLARVTFRYSAALVSTAGVINANVVSSGSFSRMLMKGLNREPGLV